MIRSLITSFLFVSIVFAVDDKPEPKSPATIFYEKAVADNSKDVEKTYAVYMKALEIANAKVIKALELAKNDLNDPKKGKLTITERAKAIEELDAKIKGIKDGAIADQAASKIKEGGGLLGDDTADSGLNAKQRTVQKMLCGTKWIHQGTYVYEFKQDMSFTLAQQNRYGVYAISPDAKAFTLKWTSNNGMEEKGTIDGTTVTFSGGPFVPKQ